LAQNLALDGRPVEAKKWLENMCKMTPKASSDALVEQWDEAAKQNSTYRTVDWKACAPGNLTAGNG
jgi:hypothetical protein